MRLWQPANTSLGDCGPPNNRGENIMGVHTSINTLQAVTKEDSNNFLRQLTTNKVITFQVAQR